MSLADEDRLLGRTYVPARGVTNSVWIPVNTHPTTTRHGRIGVDINIVNSGANPPAGANIRFNLFAPDGTFVERFEQILPIGDQWNVSLVELSKRDRFKGSVRVVSDVPVVVSATQHTESVEGNLIEVELPVIDPDISSRGVPLLLDGDGVASEIVLLNPTESVASGALRLFSETGQPREMILR